MRRERMAGVMVLTCGAMLGGALAAGPAAPAPQKEPVKDDQPAPGTHATPKSTAAQKALPQAPKPAAVSDEHKLLAEFVGKWKTTVHVMPTEANAVAKDTQGTAEGKLLMGGRFVQLSHTGVLNGQPFEGTMICGFDNVIRKYTSVWFDTTSPAIISYIGSFVAPKKQLVMTTHYSEQGTRRLTIARVEMTLPDADTIVFDEYVSHQSGGPEAHTMTITYKRA